MKKLDLAWLEELKRTFTSGLQKAGVDRKSRYLVGVSGGKDSVFLVHFLLKCNLNIAIAHLNHGARETAGRDQMFVQDMAAKFGVDFFTDTINVPELAQRERLSFEEAARIARYRFLMDIAEKNNMGGVIVGHHADDQVETVLMHLLRGSGLAGLAGMQYREINPVFSTNIPILRPMLGIWRQEINAFITENQLAFVEDETNNDLDKHRNRLRHHLLPILQEYNAGVKQHFWQTSMISQQTLSALESVQEKHWEYVLIEESENVVVWNRILFAELEIGFQQLLIRKAISQLLPTMRDFGYELTLQTIDLFNNPPEDGCWQVIGDVYAYLHLEKFYIGFLEAIQGIVEREYPQLKRASFSISVYDEISFDLGNGKHLQLKIWDLSNKHKKAWLGANDNEAWMDADIIHWPLEVRSFAAGDRFEPFGMPGHEMKVSDYFIDHKIPRFVRGDYPLLCDQQGVIWIMSERMADRCKITPNTNRMLHLQLLSETID